MRSTHLSKSKRTYLGAAPDGEVIRRRLDAIILLMLERADPSARSITGKVERLLELGFTNTETAQIVNKPPNYVTAVTANAKKRSGSGVKKT